MSRPVPQQRPGGVHAGTRAVLVAFAVFTLLATNQLVVLAGHTDRYFAWTIAATPTAAFLGAAYAAGFVLSALALWQYQWSAIRVSLLTVSVFTVLTLVATLIHTHRFHFRTGDPVARGAAWLWLAVYVVIAVACLVVVVRQERSGAPAQAVRRPMPGWLAMLLAAEGLVLTAVGAVLYAGGLTRHHVVEEWTRFWPLPLTPLTAMTVGAWLVALGFAAAIAIRERDLAQMFVPAVTYTAFGVFEALVVLRYRTQLSNDRWLWAYLVVLAAIAATGGYGCWAARPRSRMTETGVDPALQQSPSGV